MHNNEPKNDNEGKHLVFPSLAQAILLLFGYIALQMVAYLMVVNIAGSPIEYGSVASNFITLITSAIVALVTVEHMKVKVSDLFSPLGHPSSIRSIVFVFSIPLLVFCMGALYWIPAVTNVVTYFIPPSDSELALMNDILVMKIGSLVAICIIAPFVEELIFRGIILRGFLGRYSPGVAILISALLFAIFHFTVSQFPVALILGCLFGWLYYRTGSLWPCILGHIIYNSLSMLMISLVTDETDSLVTNQDLPSDVLFLFGSVLLSAAGLYMLVKLLSSSNDKTS